MTKQQIKYIKCLEFVGLIELFSEGKINIKINEGNVAKQLTAANIYTDDIKSDLIKGSWIIDKKENPFKHIKLINARKNAVCIKNAWSREIFPIVLNLTNRQN